MSSHINRKTWPLVIVGLVASTMPVRQSGARRRWANGETEDSDGV